MLDLFSYFFTTTRIWLSGYSSNDGGALFRCYLQTGRVEAVIIGANHPGSAVKRVAAFEITVVFSDSKRQVKEYNLEIDSVRVILGDVQEGERDGTGKTCRFVQVHGICTVDNTIFVTDLATGMIKMASGLSGSVTSKNAW